MPRSFLVKKHQSTKKPNYGRLDSNTDEVPSSIHENSLLPSHGPSPQHPPRQSPWLLQIPQLLSTSSSSSSTPVFLRIDRQHLPHSLNTSPLPSSAPPVEPDSLTAVEAYRRAESCTTLNQEVRHSNFLSSQDHGRRETLLPPSIPPSIPPSLPLLALVPSIPPGGCSQDKFECFDCQKAYFSFSGLAKHKQLHCDWQSKKYFSCKYCEKEYVSLGALKMHIRTHTLPCVCKLCGKAFSRPWLLQGHIRTHTGEKPFSCLHCSRAFADRSNLRAHLQTHSDVKKYQCASCSKTFSRISLLAKHQEAGCCPLS